MLVEITCLTKYARLERTLQSVSAQLLSGRDWVRLLDGESRMKASDCEVEVIGRAWP